MTAPDHDYSAACQSVAKARFGCGCPRCSAMVAKLDDAGKPVPDTAIRPCALARWADLLYKVRDVVAAFDYVGEAAATAQAYEALAEGKRS